MSKMQKYEMHFQVSFYADFISDFQISSEPDLKLEFTEDEKGI